jgi:hypothetical protein
LTYLAQLGKYSGYYGTNRELSKISEDIKGSKWTVASRRRKKDRCFKCSAQSIRGKVKQPSPITLYKIAEAYGVPYETLMEKAGHPVPRINESKNVSSGNTVFSRIGKLTSAEEESLLEYLSFLRSRKSRRGKA